MKIYILKIHEKYHSQCIAGFVIFVLSVAIYCNDSLSDKIDAFYINLFVATIFFIATFVNDFYKNISLSKYDKRKEQYFNLRKLKAIYDSFLKNDKNRTFNDFVLFRNAFLEDKENPNKPSMIEYNGFYYTSARKKIENMYQAELKYLIKRIEKNLIYRLSPQIKRESFNGFGLYMSMEGNSTISFEENVKLSLRNSLDLDDNFKTQLVRVLKQLKHRIFIFECLQKILLICAKRDQNKIIRTLDKIENVYSLKVMETARFEDDTYHNFSIIFDKIVSLERSLDEIENKSYERQNEFERFKLELFRELSSISNQIEDVDIKVNGDINF